MPPESPSTPSRFRLAALNAWNLAALGACAGLALLTKSPAPLVAAAALEAGWLTFATRPRASALLFARVHEEAAQASARARRAAIVATLPEPDRDRVRRLEERRDQILRICGEHEHLAKDVLLAEVARLEDVVDSFIELASSTHRQAAYLDAIDVGDLESETRRYEEDATRAADEDKRRLARKNLDVLLRRRDQIDELRRKLQRTRAQLDLIESTFKMIANEIMLLRSTDTLRGQLDDLVIGVQAVREMASETERDPDHETGGGIAADDREAPTGDVERRARAAAAARNAGSAGTRRG